MITTATANRLPRAESSEWPHDHSFAQEYVEEGLCIAPDIREQEVPDGRSRGLETMRSHDSLELGASVDVRRTTAS